MGKNHRHKKDLKADKAKVKLKQTKTKFLPKGLNVTNTSFKIKPIVLSEQLKEKEQNVPLSKRKLDFKDLLKRLKHHNENVRCTACEELSSMFKFHKETISRNFFEVIPAVSPMMQDRESKVRKAAVKAINEILKDTPGRKLQPFFKYFSAYLCCAMTNIDRRIQEDSLLFLDCFISSDCGFIKEASSKLLPDLFMLISRFRRESNLNHTLTLNLGSKMTSVAWRIKVLNMLHAVLECIYKADNDELNDEAPKIYVKDTTYYPFYKAKFMNVLQRGIGVEINAGNNLDEHISTLVPLLYETWLEVLPEKKSTKIVTEYTMLNEEAASILSCVMRTFYLLIRNSDKLKCDDEFVEKIFLSMEGNKFMSNLISNFPYCKNDAQLNNSRRKGLNIDFNQCVKENIMICYMFLILNGNNYSNTKHMEIDAITSYINKCLQSRNFIRGTNIQCLFELLKMCLLDNFRLWMKHGKNIGGVLEHTIDFYNSHMISKKYEIELFKILCDVAAILHGQTFEKSYSITRVCRCPKYEDWLSTLADLLCGPSISDVVITNLLDLSRKNRSPFQRALLKRLPDILENFDAFEIILTMPSLYPNPEEKLKEYILRMYTYIPRLTNAHKEKLLNFISGHDRRQYWDYIADHIKKHREL